MRPPFRTVLAAAVLVGAACAPTDSLAGEDERGVASEDAFGVTELSDGWEFRRDGDSWRPVSVPHDWSAAGPFDRACDIQVVAIVENGETNATEKTGRTGALPWIGEGEYRRRVDFPKGAEWAELEFDGVMASPEVFLDGERIGGWKYGYSPFTVELPRPGVVTVKAKNLPQSPRWYPGAGIYRPVRLRWGGRVGIVSDGLTILTPDLETVSAAVELRNPGDTVADVRFRVLDADGCCVAEGSSPLKVKGARAWSPESPYLYTLETSVSVGGKTVGSRRDQFGFRTVSCDSDGFRLNGVRRKFKGVCLHHDLGPLGAAFSKDAFRRQVALLKEMGCDAIRTSHNTPARGVLEVCDEMGMMVVAETFDSWRLPKCANGYNLFYDDWWKKDLEQLVRLGRSHPCVVMWSVGNEVPEQSVKEGASMYRAMQDHVHALASSSAAVDPFKAGAVRYVSSEGDDANDGLTLATPWKSLRRLNSGLPPGGVALLRRGDVFYGQLRVPSGLSQCRPTVIGAYGEGVPPEISAYKIAKGDESVWEHAGENLWRIDLADKTAFYGNSSTSDGNVGFLKIDGVIQGRKTFLSSRKIPAEPWEFVDDHRYLTVWCATNPASAAKDIRIAPKMDLVWCGSNVTIQNVLMRGTGAHGVSATNPSHLRMVDCGFSEIGGSHLEQNPRSGCTRYGNAVQLWRGASDVCISNCVFSEVYDVAFTMQGANPPRGWENVQVVGCVMSNCTQNFEMWTKQCANGVGYKKCAFEGNVCIGTSRGWGWDVRLDRRNGVPLLIYKMDTDVCDIAVRGNVFRDFRGALIGRGRLGMLPEGYRIEGNTVFMSHDMPLCSDPSDDPASIARESIIRRDNFFTDCDKSVPQD